MIKDIKELIDEKIISRETAEKISDYYRNKKNKEPNRLIAVFGIVGATLIGMGIILIIAHNWDHYSSVTKSIFAFLPLVIGQSGCAFALLKKEGDKTWLEASSSFLFFSVGASIALISQVYHISGSLPDFILTWMLLTLPQIYILNSSLASYFYLIGITYYAGEVGYNYYYSFECLWYWLLIWGIIPYYYKLLKIEPKSNYTIILNRLLPVSLIIALGTCTHQNEQLMFISFVSLFSAFFMFGQFPVFKQTSKNTQSYSALGLLGIIVTLIPLTFEMIWKNMYSKLPPLSDLTSSPELLSLIVTTSLASYLLFRTRESEEKNELSVIKYSFIAFIIIFLSAAISPKIAEVLTNALILFIGIRIIKHGIQEDHLGIMNYGLIVLTTVILCKFFDNEISFIIRGLVFVLLGISFFFTNYLIIQKRKKHEN